MQLKMVILNLVTWV